MEAECRDQADHPARHGPRRHNEPVVLGYRPVGEAILAARYPLEHPVPYQPAEVLAVDAVPSDLASRHDPAPPGQAKKPGSTGGQFHV